MVEHAAKRIAGLSRFVADGRFDGFADGNTKASGGVRILFQGGLSCTCFHARAGDAPSAPGLHHRFAVRFLVKADPHHVNLAFDPELRAGKSKGAAPLAGAGLGGHSLDAEDLVVVSLGNGGVGLMAARGTEAFVFKVDPCRCVQLFFQAPRSYQGSRPPDAVDRKDLLGDVDPALGAHLLLDEVHREHRRQGFRGHRLAVRPQGGVHFDVRQDIVPLPWHLIFGEGDLSKLHRFLLSGIKKPERFQRPRLLTTKKP